MFGITNNSSYYKPQVINLHKYALTKETVETGRMDARIYKELVYSL